MELSGQYPKLIAFDLDYTLWDLWIDTHVTGPLKREKGAINRVVDRYGEPISFYKDVTDILYSIKEQRCGGDDSQAYDLEESETDSKIVIAACSRTHATALARQCLDLLHVQPSGSNAGAPQAAVTLFDELEIYPGSKIKHFEALHKRTGIPYTEMLFFDDEQRNSEVERLGVTFHLVPTGVNHQSFAQGLNTWRGKRALIKAKTS